MLPRSGLLAKERLLRPPVPTAAAKSPDRMALRRAEVAAANAYAREPSMACERKIAKRTVRLQDFSGDPKSDGDREFVNECSGARNDVLR